MNVLVIAPHPDDEAIGCGGMICLHSDRGDRVAVVFLTSGELGLPHLPRVGAWRVREAEATAAAEVLGIAAQTFLRLPDWFVGDCLERAANDLRPMLDREQPTVIYLPHSADDHPDHRNTMAVVREALRERPGPQPELLTYEVWTPMATFDHVEDITATMDRKLQAIQCYASQIGHFRYDRAIAGLNQYRGALAGHCEFAEIFQSEDLTLPG
jgi:N-acetylglucosamine malate deacetylase 1